ncbi:MAG TPA: hypothetical protein VGJ84_22875 [Polyangiaceae bacterium]|jgi:uncharacterized phage protein gp47/JayE
MQPPSSALGPSVRRLAGIHFAQLVGDATTRFTPKSDFVAPADGAHSVVFRAENTGPIEAPAGTLTVIATPVVGWTAISNPTEATLGRPVDTDDTLRARRKQELAKPGTSTLTALEADLFDLTDVASVRVFENTRDVPDANSLPPHSLECLIYGPTVPDDAIAQVIWDNKPVGIPAVGSSSGTATDSQGETHSVRFSRVFARDVWLEFGLITGTGYAGAAVKSAVVAAARARFSVGDDVIALVLAGAAFSVTGVVDVVTVKLGFSPAPTGTVNLPIGPREIAAFDESRVTVS